jgi:hypothetical protein
MRLYLVKVDSRPYMVCALIKSQQLGKSNWRMPRAHEDREKLERYIYKRRDSKDGHKASYAKERGKDQSLQKETTLITP